MYRMEQGWVLADCWQYNKRFMPGGREACAVIKNMYIEYERRLCLHAYCSCHKHRTNFYHTSERVKARLIQRLEILTWALLFFFHIYQTQNNTTGIPRVDYYYFLSYICRPSVTWNFFCFLGEHSEIPFFVGVLLGTFSDICFARWWKNKWWVG